MKITLHTGDNREILKQYPDNHFDSVCTDPPYGLAFMNKKWDYSVPSKETWEEVLRVLKPGGHLISFSSSRTYHRMAVNVEDAGFEIRDQLQWLYGSGFPKSHNIGKYHTKMKDTGKCRSYTKTGLGDTNGRFAQGGQGTVKTEQIEIDSEWKGWGTALKPAQEPIVLARKPLSEKTVLNNVLKWGTGGLNIDGCRVEHNDTLTGGFGNGAIGFGGGDAKGVEWKKKTEGRWPANVIHDGSDEVLEGFPESKGTVGAKLTTGNVSYFDNKKGQSRTKGIIDEGSAARFFYCAKVSKKERNAGLEAFDDRIPVGRDPGQDERSVPNKPRPITSKNHHPTVKPVDLMAYLVRLITPPGGIVLDPFMGSGSTGMAAKQEGNSFVGIDMEKEYTDISQARIDAWNK